MTRSRPLSGWLAFALVALAMGCGGGGLGLGITDGGPVGTGIVASVSGNVVAVEDFDATDAASLESTASVETAPLGDALNVDGIAVSLVEFPDVETTTDTDGNFNLEGEFDGSLTLRFRTQDIEADQQIEVPSGGTVVLSDIEIERDGAVADAGRQLDVRGRVRTIDCGAGRFTVEVTEEHLFDVVLTDETEFSRDGARASCSDLREGDRVSIDSLPVDIAAREISAFAVEIDPDDTAPRRQERVIPFVGFLGAVDCADRNLAVTNGQNVVRLSLPADVRIEDVDGSVLECGDLSVGDRLTGTAILNLRRPGRLRVEELARTGRVGPGQRLEIRGEVIAANCPEGILQVSRKGSLVSVRLTSDTIVLRPRNFDCEELFDRPHNIRGEGVVSPDVRGAIDALAVEFKPIRRGG